MAIHWLRLSTSREDSRQHSFWPRLIVLSALMLLLLALLLPRQRNSAETSVEASSLDQSAPASKVVGLPRVDLDRRSRGEAQPNAEQIVTAKVNQFANGRLGITHAMAKHFKVEVPPEVEKFFAAAAAGRWDELQSLYESLKKQREGGAHAESLQKIWGPILETLLISECAHDWPAQKLLDYGQAILGSLRPGMVYVGGSDPGRGIPTLLNETSEGERHLVLTQNALADNSYLEYLSFLYGDRFNSLTPEDSQRSFQTYLEDARKRLTHDLRFPDEPKQVSPGEDIHMTDQSGQDAGLAGSRLTVSGQVAVMAINENLLQTLMNKNPELSFALEESFPLRSTYDQAVPLGPLMELRAPGEQNAWTPERAAQSVDYWRSSAQQLLADGDAPEGSDPRKAYSHMAVAHANLLESHNYSVEAEQTLRTALQIWPEIPEGVYGLAELLARTGRADEARQILAKLPQKK